MIAYSGTSDVGNVRCGGKYCISKGISRRWMEEKATGVKPHHNTPAGRASVDSTVGGAVMLYGPSDILEASVPERDWLPWLVGV
jgi:hypothetical protein